MAITNAQQARQLYIKGGQVNPDGRRGFFSGAYGKGAGDRGGNPRASKAENVAAGRTDKGNVTNNNKDDKPSKTKTKKLGPIEKTKSFFKNQKEIINRKRENKKKLLKILNNPEEYKEYDDSDENIKEYLDQESTGFKGLGLGILDPKGEMAKYDRNFMFNPEGTDSKLFGKRNSMLSSGNLTYNGIKLSHDNFDGLPTELKNIIGKDITNRRNSGEIFASGNLNPFSKAGKDAMYGIDAKSAGAERGDNLLPVQEKVIPEVEEEDPIAYRFMADGGRAAFQEGGGIFPRLNELGSNVSSAEQELAALSQKINSAESTLGEGGGDEGGLGSIMPEDNNFTNPTLEAFSGTGISVKGGPGGFDNVPDGFGTRPALYTQLNPNVKPPGPFQTLQAGSGDLYGSLNKPLQTGKENPYFRTFPKGFTPGLPVQLGNSAPSTNLPGSGAPQAGDVVYDPTGMPNIFAPRNGYADGGMSEYEGGIMDLESGRQQYFLGKLVKKAKKTIGKIYKSPLGKAALLGLGGKALFGKMGGFSGLKGSLFGTAGGKAAMTSGLLGKLGLTGGGGSMGLTGLGKLASLAGVSGLAGLMSKDDEEEYQDTYTGADFDLEGARKFPYKAMGGAYRFYANGGRTGYSSGSEDLSKSDVYQKWVQRYKANPDSPLVTMHEKADVFKNFYERSKNAKAEGGEPVAKETMPLLDMDGKEMDLRAEGGFVPLGRMEKADDVPARLSKNEFVFTADAVRNAGNGNVDKGAEVMYKTMKNLEAGGKMSKKSQGLEGIL